MNQKRIVFIVALLLMGGTAFALTWLGSNKRLGRPGIKAESIAGSKVVMKIELPAQVLDFTSTNLPQEKIVLDYLPADTSFARRMYFRPDGAPIDANIILMGMDRSSIHKADYCLKGAGFTTEKKETVQIPITGPVPYELSVAKWTVNRVVEQNGEKRIDHALYVFWFATDGASTPSHFWFRMKLMWNVVRTGTLQRWAYISYVVPCEPGREDAAFERAAKLIAASVPEFQLPPGGRPGADVVQR
jgi:hypothetical protein